MKHVHTFSICSSTLYRIHLTLCSDVSAKMSDRRSICERQQPKFDFDRGNKYANAEGAHAN